MHDAPFARIQAQINQLMTSMRILADVGARHRPVESREAAKALRREAARLGHGKGVHELAARLDASKN